MNFFLSIMIKFQTYSLTFSQLDNVDIYFSYTLRAHIVLADPMRPALLETNNNKPEKGGSKQKNVHLPLERILVSDSDERWLKALELHLHILIERDTVVRRNRRIFALWRRSLRVLELLQFQSGVAKRISLGNTVE